MLVAALVGSCSHFTVPDCTLPMEEVPMIMHAMQVVVGRTLTNTRCRLIP